MTISEKLELLSKDFLDRDETTFIKQKTDGRLNWEESVQGGSYSEFILHPESTEDLIKNAYSIATDMIKVMDSPFPVTINITGNSNCTNSKVVYVGTKVFDDPTLSIGSKLDAFIGYTIHEGCHLLYTDFSIGHSEKLISSLSNIIEDERIERLCGETKPGLVNFLKITKYYSFDLYRKQLKDSGKLDNLDKFKRILNAVLALIRYPKALEPADAKEFVDILLETRDILTPYPTSTIESFEAAKKISDIIKDYLKQHPDNDNKDNGNKACKNSEQSPSSNTIENNTNEQEEHEHNDIQDSSNSGGKTPDQNTSESTSAQSTPESSTALTSKEIEKKIENSLSEIQPALNLIADSPKTNLSEEDKSETIKEEHGKVGKICSGELERGKLRGSYIAKCTPDENNFKSALDTVKPYISSIRRFLRMSSTEYKLSLRGMRSGILDTNKLAEAFQGVPTIYMREGEVTTTKINVCILIDESGSMWGPGESAARNTAVLLSEALSGINNVDLYIYGHTASRNTTTLYVYYEKGKGTKYGLGGTDSRSGNHDSVAIREAANRVRKYTKEKCLFFMISDGAPNESTTYVRNAVREVEKDGFNVVAISIDPYYDPSTMYSHNVIFSDLSTLATDVGKMVKQAILDSTNKQINL